MDKETYEQKMAFSIQKALDEASERHHLKPYLPKMSRRRFKKLMMSYGTPRDAAERICLDLGKGLIPYTYAEFYIWILAHRNSALLDVFLGEKIEIGG